MIELSIYSSAVQCRAPRFGLWWMWDLWMFLTCKAPRFDYLTSEILIWPLCWIAQHSYLKDNHWPRFGYLCPFFDWIMKWWPILSCISYIMFVFLTPFNYDDDNGPRIYLEDLLFCDGGYGWPMSWARLAIQWLIWMGLLLVLGLKFDGLCFGLIWMDLDIFGVSLDI